MHSPLSMAYKANLSNAGIPKNSEGQAAFSQIKVRLHKGTKSDIEKCRRD
jgi:hypothetical protein